MKVLSVIGTRPEAIKMAMVVRALSDEPNVHSEVCVTAQHRGMLDQVLSLFRINPDYDLNLMKPGQRLEDVFSGAIEGLGEIIRSSKPDWVLVQGDTATAFAGALAAFLCGARVAHVEAGLRTRELHSPWPEEGCRQMIGRIADLHFAPTERAKRNLIAEAISPANVIMTGNTVVDALHHTLQQIQVNDGLSQDLTQKFSFFDDAKPLVLATGHRRENLDQGLHELCFALKKLASEDDIEVVFPVHPNPQVRGTVEQYLANVQGIYLVPPLGYTEFIYLMKRADLVISDSGGVQEEAPSLGTPVLVTRENTERPEALESGDAILVGTSAASLILAAKEVLSRKPIESSQECSNPFGDGRAAERIVAALLRHGGSVNPLESRKASQGMVRNRASIRN